MTHPVPCPKCHNTDTNHDCPADRIAAQVATNIRNHAIRQAHDRLGNLRAEVKLVRRTADDMEPTDRVPLLDTHLRLADKALEDAMWAIEKALNPKIK